MKQNRNRAEMQRQGRNTRAKRKHKEKQLPSRLWEGVLFFVAVMVYPKMKYPALMFVALNKKFFVSSLHVTRHCLDTLAVLAIICLFDVTLLVSQPLRFRAVSLEQPLNIWAILPTQRVSQSLRFKDSSPEQ